MPGHRSFSGTAACRAARLFLTAGFFCSIALQFPAASPALLSQERQALTKPLQHEVSVVMKLIQVYVTDKKGKPVEDLRLEDFAVTDNGRLVVLTDFERHCLQPSPEEAPKAEPVAAPVAPTPTRKFFLFFDFAFNSGRGLVKAKTAALHFLDSKVGQDEDVGILTYTMLKGVRVHEYLTKDHAKIREVVDSIGSKDLAGRASELELQYWLQAQEPLAGVGSEGFAEANAGKPVIDPNKNTREEGKRIAQTFILRLTALAKALRY